MQARVLIIEDVAELADLVAMYLGKEGIETKTAESAEIAIEILPSWKCDLIILDINLPGMDGFEFLHQLRKKDNIPVLIVSARDADEDIITGLGYGADEFVNKPFSPRVLVARVRALLRRIQDAPDPENDDSMAFGPFTLDMNACLLKKGSERVPLSAKEYEVLAFLVKHAGKPLSPEVIYSSVWKNTYGDITAVAVYIQRLRKKLEADGGEWIETVYGMGYRFNLIEKGPAA